MFKKIQWVLLFLAAIMVVLIVVMLESNLELIPMQIIYMRIKENSIPTCRAGPLARVHVENFYLT